MGGEVTLPASSYPHPSSFPSSGGYPSGPTGTPGAATDLDQAQARDLQATVTFTVPTGYGWAIDYATGAGQTPPDLPLSGGGWTNADLDPTDAAGGTLTVTLPTNDDDYTLAVWAANTDGTWSPPITINVFGLDAPTLGPAGARYASVQVTTTRRGWPKIEVDTDPAFGSPTVYDGEADTSGWLVCLTSGDVQTGTGTALPTTGFPPGSNGRYLRVTLPVAYSNRHVRGYQGSEPTA